MKKGLLSLLALALTVVGCQNYDDQFAELTTLIESVQADVDGLSDLQSDVDALAATLNGLSTAVAANASAIAAGNSAAATAAAANATAIADGNAAAAAAAASNASAIAANASATAAAAAAAAAADAANAGAIAANGGAIASLASGLTALQTQVATIQASLTTVADADDITALNAELALIQEDLDELLAANATINQSITINSLATLKYAESLIGTDTTDANVIINGYVRIDNTSLTSAERDRVDVVAAQIATILGDSSNEGLTVTSDDAVTFTVLTFVDADVELNDSAQDIDALVTITGQLTTDYEGPQNFDHLSTVTTLTITNNASATTLNLDGVDIDSVITGSGSAGELVLNGASFVNLGDASFTQLEATSASSITANVETTSSLTITATAADSIDLNSLETATGALTITATGSTILHVDALESAAAITVSDSDESHFGALESASGVIDVAADGAADFSSLEDLAAAATIGGESVNLSALAANTTGTLTLPDATTASLPLLVASNNVTATAAAAVTLVELETGVELDAPAAAELTLSGQEDDFTVAAATDYPSLVTLNVTGKDVTLTDFDLTVSAATTLTTVNAGGEISSLVIDGAGVETVVTTGKITTLDITGAGVDSLTLGSSFISGDEAVSITVSGTAITSLDMSQVQKVKSIELVNNGSLATLVGPSATVLPEAGASITVTMSTNSLTAAYTDGVSPTAATETTSAVAATAPVITSASVASILAWFNAAAANSTAATSTSIDIENVEFDSSSAGPDGDINDAWAQDDYASEKSPASTGTIDANDERAQVTAS